MSERTPETMARADRVFGLLDDIGDLSKQQLVNLTGYTEEQVLLSLRIIKELLAGLHAEPIVYDARRNVYVLGADREQVEEYYQMRAKVTLVQSKNLLTGTLEPALQSLGDSPYVRLARRQMARMVEDLEELTS
jgi:hypothetical protein